MSKANLRLQTMTKMHYFLRLASKELRNRHWIASAPLWPLASALLARPLFPTLHPILLLFIILELVAKFARASVFRASAWRVAKRIIVANLFVEIHLVATTLVIILCLSDTQVLESVDCGKGG